MEKGEIEEIELVSRNNVYRSEAAEAIHRTASGLFEAGVIEEQTMREFDEACLTPLVEPILSN